MIKISRYPILIYKSLNRNQYGINDIPSKKNRVNVEHSQLLNVGDTLGPIIVNWMCAQKGIDVNKEVKNTKHLMTVGSIIGRGKFDTTVWGSGVLKLIGDNRLEKYKKIYHRKIDFRAIRGPYSREIVLKTGYDCPEIYGDPAILMPLIYKPKYTKEYELSIILHHRTTLAEYDDFDEGEYKIRIKDDFLNQYHPHFIDPKTDNYKQFIDEILKSKLVISSSLHGIILAESYGIPSVFLNWGMDDQPIKFYDWYSSTGREIKFIRRIQDMQTVDAPELPDISLLQENLMDSFPYDLWED